MMFAVMSNSNNNLTCVKNSSSSVFSTFLYFSVQVCKVSICIPVVFSSVRELILVLVGLFSEVSLGKFSIKKIPREAV